MEVVTQYYAILHHKSLLQAKNKLVECVIVLLLLGHVTLCRAKVAYSHQTFPPTICWSVCLCVSVCLVHCGNG